jgi:hypothetical protein
MLAKRLPISLFCADTVHFPWLAEFAASAAIGGTFPFVMHDYGLRIRLRKAEDQKARDSTTNAGYLNLAPRPGLEPGTN